MIEFRPDLPARDVDRHLRASLQELQRIERNTVLWFADVLRRKLYRDLGYGSMHQYARVALGFGPAKTSQFIRLGEALHELPRLRESVARGELGWTKARTVAAVATPETEEDWLAAAKSESRHVLEDRARQARSRTRARTRRARGRDQAALPLTPPARGVSPSPTTPPEVPVTIQVRFSPEQFARYEALMERLRRRGRQGDRAELLLEGLAGMADETPDRRERRAGNVTPPPYQVHVRLCPSCSGGSVVTGRGEKPLRPQELRTILCDARTRRRGERNKAVIPPRIRREVLERDGFRCRAAGCGRAHFLAVHHLAPREAGGSNDPENLITLCGSCHRAVHAHDHSSDFTRGKHIWPRTGGRSAGDALIRPPTAGVPPQQHDRLHALVPVYPEPEVVDPGGQAAPPPIHASVDGRCLCGSCHRALQATDRPAIPPRKEPEPVRKTPTGVPG